MVTVIEDSDEDYLDDPIRLIDFEQKRIKLTDTLVQESIELSDSDVDVVTLPKPKSNELSKPARPSCKIVSSTLPVNFFKISRNIELLNKCFPLRIKIVDCNKHPWYFKRKFRNIKSENVLDATDKINTNIKKCTGSVEGTVDEITMKLKIRPVDVKSYLKSPIRDIKSTMCRQNNDNLNKLALRGSDEKSISPRNIDFKKNQGLVGLKIVYDVNIKSCNPKTESNKQLNETKIPNHDLQYKKDEDVQINVSPKNPHKKRDDHVQMPVTSCPGFVGSSDTKKINHEEKRNPENSILINSQSTSKMCKEKKSNQGKDESASKKDKKKEERCTQKTKPKVSKEQKHVNEPNVTETLKIDQNKRSNKKETNMASQKHEMEVVYNEIKNNDKTALKKKKTKTAIIKTSEKEYCLKNENCHKVNLGHDVPVGTKISSNIAKDSEKRPLEKCYLEKVLQQNINNQFEQPKDNLQKYEKGTNKDPLPVSIGRVTTGVNSKNIQKKSMMPRNEEVRNDMFNVHNHLPISAIMRPHTGKSFIFTDINDRKIDVFASQMPGKLKTPFCPCPTVGQSNSKDMPSTIGQSNSKDMPSSFDLPINNKNYMKTNVHSQPESKVVINERNTDNKIPNYGLQIRDQTLRTSKVANSQSNVKSVLRAPAPSKKEQRNELQKQELSKQHFNIGSSEYTSNKQVPVLSKKMVLYPVSILAENNRITLDQTAQEKRLMPNEKLASSNNSLATMTPTIPTSAVHQSLDPRLLRYHLVSQNGSLPKEVPKSVPQTQTLLQQNVAQTPNTKCTPNILNHARIIIKRPTSEANSIHGQELAEKQYYSNISPNKTFKLIPTLTSTQKGRYVIIDKNFVNKNILVHEQNKNFGPYNNQERLQKRIMPKLDNTAPQYKTSNEYLLPSVSPHKNQVDHKECVTKKRKPSNQANQQPNSYRKNEFHKGNSTQNTNLQQSQTNISGHSNYDHNALQPPLPNSLQHSNPELPYYINNEHAQYYNDNSLQNTNQLPLLNQEPKQNEYGYYYNNNTMQNTEQPPLQPQPNQNQYESYYNHSTLVNSYQESPYLQQNPNGNGSGPNQNTILNLDTNTLMQPPPVYDYLPQNTNDMDCAYWNGVNYLGDEWQQGYPQPTQPTPPVFPQYMTPPPEYQHPPQVPYHQNLQPPPNMQQPQPPMASDIPPQSTVPLYPQPPPVSQNLPMPAATQYPQPAPFTQHPPPPVPQHQIPAMSHPSSYLPATVTQGSTILGSNNNGVVRTINLVPSTTTAPKETTSKNSSFGNNDIPVNTKSEMLQELSKSMEIGSPNLKRSISDTNNNLSKFPSGNLQSGPLAKVRKMDVLAADARGTQKALNNGYSPPILPIPTYEKTYEYIAQVSGSMEQTENNRVDEIVDKYNGKKIESILKKKSDFDEYADGHKGDKSVKKISIDEYKNRANNTKTEGNDVVKTEIKSESKFYDSDLGYDSDSTVIL